MVLTFKRVKNHLVIKNATLQIIFFLSFKIQLSKSTTREGRPEKPREKMGQAPAKTKYDLLSLFLCQGLCHKMLIVPSS